MSKEAYYFSHDSNARNDEKIIALRMKLGWEGYGLFWAIIERLRESSDYMSVKDYNLLAFDLRAKSEIIKSIIQDFGLFAFTEDGKCFYSERLMKSMTLKESKSEKARLSAEKRWNKLENDANAMRTHNDSNAIKESKVKEKKENEKDEVPPQQKTFKQFSEDEFRNSLVEFVSEFGKVTVRQFFNYWSEPSTSGKMRFQLEKTWDSKRRLITWKNNEGKFGTEQKPKIEKQTVPGPWNA